MLFAPLLLGLKLLPPTQINFKWPQTDFYSINIIYKFTEEFCDFTVREGEPARMRKEAISALGFHRTTVPSKQNLHGKVAFVMKQLFTAPRLGLKWLPF